MQLTSSAFPENKNPKIQSKVHELLKKHLEKFPIPPV